MKKEKLHVWRTCKGEGGEVWLGQHRVPVQGERWTTSHAIASRATVLLSRTTYILFWFFPIFFVMFHLLYRRIRPANTATRYTNDLMYIRRRVYCSSVSAAVFPFSSLWGFSIFFHAKRMISENRFREPALLGRAGIQTRSTSNKRGGADGIPFLISRSA